MPVIRNPLLKCSTKWVAPLDGLFISQPLCICFKILNFVLNKVSFDVFNLFLLGDMIDRMSLLYNRTRQAVITTELVEIISGMAAL